MTEESDWISGVWNYLAIASITAAVLMPVAWTCCRAFKLRSAALRHQVWLYVLLTVVIWPAVWSYMPRVSLAVLPVAEPSPPAAAQPAPVAAPLPGAESMSGKTVSYSASHDMRERRTSSWMPWVVGLWFAGVLLMLSRLLVAAVRLGRIRRHARPARVSADGVRVFWSDEIEGPVCCGVLRPVVLLPRAFVEAEDRQGLGMVLAHESAHIRRKDHLANLFQRLMEALFFFHPCIWYASRELTRERELICDQHVVHGGISATEYVKFLSKMVEHGRGRPSPEAVALFEGHFLSRVRLLLDCRETLAPELPRATRLISAALATAMLLAAGTLRLEGRTEEKVSAGETIAAASTASSQEPAELDPVRDAMRSIGRAILQYWRREGRFPESLDLLGEAIPADPHSPSGDVFHYEPARHTFVLGSRGPDGQYGNDDDVILYFTLNRGYKGPHYGKRAEIYPLPQVDSDAQLETGRPDRPRPKGKGSIGGRVVSAVDGEPIDHATVYLFYTDTFAPMFVHVAADGSFLFEDIPSGEYRLRTTRVAGYQDAVYNPEEEEGYPRFTLAEGEHRTDILLELKPAYSISGRVHGEDRGDMLVLAWAERRKGPEGFEIVEQLRLEPDGSYRIDGLDGRPVYVMAVDWRREPSEGGYCPQYHPGTFSRDEAALIAYDEAAHVAGVDIELRRTGGMVLEGTVSDETNRPVPRAFVVAHRSDMFFDLIPAYTDENGRYAISCLGEGEFLVHVNAVQHNLVRTRTTVQMDESIAPVRLDFVLHRGVRIAGRLVDEQGDPWEIDRSFGFAHTQDHPQAAGSFTLTGFYNKDRTHSVQDHFGESFQLGDGDYDSSRMVFRTRSTFVLEGVMAGTTLIKFEPKKEGQVLKRILYEGRGITETGLVTQPGQEATDVIIVIGAES